MRDDIQPAVRMRSSGIECAGGSRTLVGKGATEIIGIGLDGYIERSDGDKVVQRISVSQETALLGQSFLAKGYCVDTVGLNGEMIQKYVRFQEKEEQHQEQLQLEPGRAPSWKAR